MAICGSAETGHQIRFSFQIFIFFSPAWVTHLGVTANVRNFKLLVRTVHTYTCHPVSMKDLPCLV